jgi:hypothetical protein
VVAGEEYYTLAQSTELRYAPRLALALDCQNCLSLLDSPSSEALVPNDCSETQFTLMKKVDESPPTLVGVHFHYSASA